MGMRSIGVSLALAVAVGCPPALAQIAPSGWEEDQPVAADIQPEVSQPNHGPAKSIYERNMELLGIPREQWASEPADAGEPPGGTITDPQATPDVQPAPFVQSPTFSPGSWVINKIASGFGSTAGSVGRSAKTAVSKTGEGMSSPTGQAVLGTLLAAGLLAGAGVLAWQLGRNSGGSVASSPCTTWVNPYVRSDGVYVPGHYRTCADSTMYNNYSRIGTVNPFTGRLGYIVPTH